MDAALFANLYWALVLSLLGSLSPAQFISKCCKPFTCSRQQIPNFSYHLFFSAILCLYYMQFLCLLRKNIWLVADCMACLCISGQIDYRYYFWSRWYVCFEVMVSVCQILLLLLCFFMFDSVVCRILLSAHCWRHVISS